MHFKIGPFDVGRRSRRADAPLFVLASDSAWSPLGGPQRRQLGPVPSQVFSYTQRGLSPPPPPPPPDPLAVLVARAGGPRLRSVPVASDGPRHGSFWPITLVANVCYVTYNLFRANLLSFGCGDGAVVGRKSARHLFDRPRLLTFASVNKGPRDRTGRSETFGEC